MHDAVLEPFLSHPTLGKIVTWFLDETPEPSSEGRFLPPVDHPDFQPWILVGRGPSLPENAADDSHDTWIWIRREAADDLYFGLHERTPPSLFIPCHGDPERLVDLCEAFSTERKGPRDRQRERHLHVVLGIAEEMNELEERFAADPFVHAEPVRLGIAVDPEDPETLGGEPSLVLESELLTRYSGSAIRLEGWSGFLPGRIVIARVAYEPWSFSEVVLGYDEAHDKAYPDDTPVDVIGAFHDLLSWQRERILSQIERREEPVVMLVFLTLLELHDPKECVRLLARWADDPELGVSATELQKWVAGLFGLGA